ncbi:MAG TPA: hypothetical protein VN259_13005 [Xanthomonadales bacterium]|nr:hypothetical protein [Xanthomonadales bacterium]
MLGLRCVLLGVLMSAALGLHAAVPESGWWWNPLEPGRGYFVEMQGGRVFLAAFLYADDGRATWSVALMDGDATAGYAGPLQEFRDGQTLNGGWRQNRPLLPGPGNIRIDAADTRHARLTWPGGVVAIERLELTPGGLAATRPPGTPETGWWWNANEPGRGFGVEIQAGSMFVGAFLYDDDGNPVWVVSGAAPMSGASQYRGQWLRFGGGQSMAGNFRPAQLLDSSASLQLDFATSIDATLSLPDGHQTTLRRLVYASQPEITWTPAVTLTSVPTAGSSLSSSSRLQASWAAPAGMTPSHYALRVIDLGSSETRALTSSGNSIVLTELKAASEYRVEVSVCSEARCFLTQTASASASTPGEVWQLQGSGNTVAGLRRVVADGNVKIHALRYGADAPTALAGRVQAYYGPAGGPALAGLAVASANAPASATDPLSFLSLTSLAGSSGLIRPSTPAALVADVATGQAVPLSAAMGGGVRLYFEALGGGRTRILSIDSADGYTGRDFNRGAATTCASAADYSAGGGCAPSVVIGIDTDVGGNPRIPNARQFKIGVPTQTDWRWDGAAGTFMWFTADTITGCSNVNRNHVYAVYDGTRFVVQYDGLGCPRHIRNVQAGHPMHLGGVRWKFYYGDTSDLSGALPGSTLPYLGPKRVLYANGALSGDPTRVDFEDWENVAVGRRVRFLWPNGEPLSDSAEGYIDDFSIIAPTGSLDLQLLYVAITDGRIAPLMAAAVLENP